MLASAQRGTRTSLILDGSPSVPASTPAQAAPKGPGNPHSHTAVEKNGSLFTWCQKQERRCQTREPFCAQSTLEMGQVKSQALLMKSLHAGPRNRMLEQVR